LIAGVNMSLGLMSIDSCPSFDVDRNGQITIDELIRATNSALNGC